VSFFANSAGFAILKNSFAKPEILLCNSFDQGLRSRNTSFRLRL